MSEDKRERKLFAPLLIMGSAWAIRKSMKKTQTVIEKKRASEKPKSKHEEIAWKLGLTLALASAEALINSLMSKSTDEQESAD
jgi:hypothetical protein